MPSWNIDILHLINQEWTHPLLDWLMPALAYFKAWAPVLAILIIVVAWRGGRQARLMLLSIALAIGIGDGLVSNSLKKVIRKDRPHEALNSLTIRDLGSGQPPILRLFKKPQVHRSKGTGGNTGSKSFPSSHTVNMFACATVMAFFYRRWGIVCYVLAATIAYGRIYVGAHWPEDIPPSIGIGLLVGWGTVKGVQAVARRWQRQGGGLQP